MAEVQIRFQPGGETVSVAPQATLLEAAARAGLALRAPCGGQGRCGKCAVRVEAGEVASSAADRRLFSEAELAQGWRLACQARVGSDVQVFVPPSAFAAVHHIVVEGAGRDVVVEPNVRKVALRLPRPSAEDARDDLTRVLDALGKGPHAPRGVRVLRRLPTALRPWDHEVTATLVGENLVEVERGDTSGEAYGAAVDIGTTTVVLYLCHLPTGEVAAVTSELNPQSAYGDDVISRLQLASSGPEGLGRLHDAITQCLNRLLGQAAEQAGIARRQVYEMVVAGNTAMMHLFLGLPPGGLVRLPFVPVFRDAQMVPAAGLGIQMHPAGEVYVLPLIGGWVGADTVGVILASELDVPDGLRVAVDIGTNGEIVVAEDGELWACSTAAGPAFEGARISRGMRAAPGAIDRLSIDGDVHLHVIGGSPARGLCGSGLVDAVAELVRVGLVEENGRLRGPEELPQIPEKVRRRLVEKEGGLEFVLSPGEEGGRHRAVALTARDVRETQLAKGAIFAGLELLLEQLGRGPEEIEQLLLAGAFGNYIRRESAVAIGLVPAIPKERVCSIGNAAGLGARLALCSVSLRRRAEAIARRVHHVELSGQEAFYDRFAEAMVLRPLPRPAEAGAADGPMR